MKEVTFACTIGLSFLSGTLSAQALLQEAAPVRRLVPKADETVDDRLKRTLDEIRLSFLERDTGRLGNFFGRKKVFLSLKSPSAEDGYYTRSQLLFIFEEIFRELQTRSFKFSAADVSISQEGRAFFRTEWTYVVAGSEATVTEHLHFSFEKDKNGWRISEIKAAPK